MEGRWLGDGAPRAKLVGSVQDGRGMFGAGVARAKLGKGRKDRGRMDGERAEGEGPRRTRLGAGRMGAGGEGARRKTGEVAVGVVPQRLPYKEIEIFFNIAKEF